MQCIQSVQSSAAALSHAHPSGVGGPGGGCTQACPYCLGYALQNSLWLPFGLPFLSFPSPALLRPPLSSLSFLFPFPFHFYFYFLLKIDFPLKQYICSVFSLHDSQLLYYLLSPPDPLLPFSFLFRKDLTSKKPHPNRTNKIQKDKAKAFLSGWRRQPSWKKRVPRAGKRNRDTPAPTVKRLSVQYWTSPLHPPAMPLHF